MFWKKRLKKINEGLDRAEKLEERICKTLDEEPRQDAMAEYLITITALDGDKKEFKWKDRPSRFLASESRPYRINGAMVKNGKKTFFIPWAQIKHACLIENVLWDDTGE